MKKKIRIINRILIISLIYFSNLFSNTSRVIYQPIFLSQCSEKKVNHELYWIEKDEMLYSPTDDSINSVLLPDTGEYQLYLADKFDDPLDIYLPKFGVNVDTLFSPKILFFQYISNPPYSEYKCCDALCNGLITDYYYSGNIRMVGKFENGQPIDTLKEYYPNGQLKLFFYPFNKKYEFAGREYNEYIYIKFDKHGNRISYKNTKDDIEIFYYANNIIKSVEFYKDGKVDYIEYYSDKKVKKRILKNSYCQYYPNGKIKIRVNRYERFLYKIFFLFLKSSELGPLLTYDFKEFDSTGKIIREIKFDSYDRFSPWGFPENLESIKIEDN